uniref:Programmed cell death protein 2 C-terminal domain-containing protein n=1 Tax=Leersia perrieri TaxID=77586 RepID=A0A0D9VT24_9ORYZ
MESSAEKLRGLTITSLDEEEDEPELPHRSPSAAGGIGAGYEDEDDDEEEEEAEVTLGFLEKPKHPGLLLRHLFPSKAGGIPAWLDPVNLPSGNSRCCGFCGEPLQFALQIYAPLEDNSAAFHRTLFMFMCPSMACLLRDQHEQWKHRQGSPCRSVKVFRCQLPRSNAFYSSEPPKHNSSDKPLCPGVPASKSWPEYEIAIDYEGAFDSDSCDESNSKSLVMQRPGKPDDMMQSWMDQFEADADNKCWASFQERISRAPKQVLRYCRESNAKPLWALSAGCPSNADIPSCSYCKGPLCYEFQIMPQLLYYFGVKNEPDSLDWATVVVYTCQGSCNQNVSYMEEFAWVQELADIVCAHFD